jgi:TetR/AcrR family transcriptional repressor of bet genes
MPGTKRPEGERREEILAAAYRVAVRDQLGGLSVRAVAAEAGVSKGLVFFHFSDKETLLTELLDWLLRDGPRVEVPEDLDAGDPVRRLAQVVEHQVALLPERQGRVQLFLDFWVMGSGVPDLRARIRDAFDRYREELLPYTRAAAAAQPGRFDGGDPAGLAAVLVSFIQGCALQMNAAPATFDVSRYVRALRGLVAVE